MQGLLLVGHHGPMEAFGIDGSFLSSNTDAVSLVVQLCIVVVVSYGCVVICRFQIYLFPELLC
jgi:hypothetical protein